MAYIKTVDNGTTIIVTCPDDTITFTIATANARLMEANPQRAWIQDDNGDWFIYPTMMFNYGTAQTGMAGNDYSRQVISGNWSWYPLASANETNASAITTSLQDTTMDDPANGSWVDDLNMPDNIGVDGFAIDGAIHIEPSGGMAKFTFDRTRYNQPVVIHDANFQTGTVASPTEHLIAKWDCASTTLNTGTGSVTVTNATYASGIRGNGVLIDANAEVAYIQSSGNLSSTAGSYIFNITGNDGSGTANARFFQQSIATDRLELFWTNATTIGANINGTSITFTTAIDPLDGNPHVVMFSFDTINNLSMLAIDGMVQDVDRTTITAPTVSTGYFYIGNAAAGTSPIEALIDEFKIYNAYILPYGGPFLDHGNDYASPHESVLVYVKGDESNTDNLKIGNGTLTVSGATHADSPSGETNGAFLINSDTHYVSFSSEDGVSNFDSEQGTIQFWYYGLGTIGNYNKLFLWDGVTNDFVLMRPIDDTEVRFFYNNSYITATLPADYNMYDDGIWTHLLLSYDRLNNVCRIAVNGKTIYNGSMPSTTALGTTGIHTFYIGNDSGFDDFCGGRIAHFSISNNPNIPNNWSAMGAPRLLPLLEVTD